MKTQSVTDPKVGDTLVIVGTDGAGRSWTVTKRTAKTLTMKSSGGTYARATLRTRRDGTQIWKEAGHSTDDQNGNIEKTEETP